MTVTRRIVPPLLALAVVVVTWAAGIALFDPPSYLLPTPGEVTDALWRTRSSLAGHAGSTLAVAILGLALGAVTGAALALALALSAPVRRAIQPLVVVSQSVPMVVLAPVLITWFGFGIGPRLLVVAIISFFPVAVATLDGLLGADDELIELIRSYGGRRRDVLALVQLPAAVPGFFAGLKVSGAYAMFGAVVAEWMGAEQGLGVYLERSRASYRIDQLFAAVVVIAVTSIVIYAVIAGLARVATPWRSPSTPPSSPVSAPEPRPVPDREKAAL